MILLDTNVLSALMADPADTAVTSWINEQPRESIWTSSITVMELKFGLFKMPTGRRQEALAAALEKLFREKIEGRIAIFDTLAAERSGELMAERRRRGRPVELRDTMIAGIAVATRATVVTRNVDHFTDADVPVVNPWLS